MGASAKRQHTTINMSSVRCLRECNPALLQEEDLPDDLDDLDEADEEAVEEGKG